MEDITDFIPYSTNVFQTFSEDDLNNDFMNHFLGEKHKNDSILNEEFISFRLNENIKEKEEDGEEEEDEKEIAIENCENKKTSNSLKNKVFFITQKTIFKTKKVNIKRESILKRENTKISEYFTKLIFEATNDKNSKEEIKKIILFYQIKNFYNRE